MFTFTHNYNAFVGLVNENLKKRKQEGVQESDLIYVNKWFHAQATERAAYMKAVEEIIQVRTKSSK